MFVLLCTSILLLNSYYYIQSLAMSNVRTHTLITHTPLIHSIDLTEIPADINQTSTVSCFGREEHDDGERRDHLRPTGPMTTLGCNRSRTDTVVRPRTDRDTAVKRLQDQRSQGASDMALTSSKSTSSPRVVNTWHHPVSSRPSSLESDDDMALPDGGYGTVSDVNNLDIVSQQASLAKQANNHKDPDDNGNCTADGVEDVEPLVADSSHRKKILTRGAQRGALSQHVLQEKEPRKKLDDEIYILANQIDGKLNQLECEVEMMRQESISNRSSLPPPALLLEDTPPLQREVRWPADVSATVRSSPSGSVVADVLHDPEAQRRRSNQSEIGEVPLQAKQTSSGGVMVQDNSGGETLATNRRCQSNPMTYASQGRQNNGNDSARSSYMTLTNDHSINHINEKLIEAIARRVADSLHQCCATSEQLMTANLTQQRVSDVSEKVVVNDGKEKFIEQHEPLPSTSCARQQGRTVLWLHDDDASSDAASDVTSLDGSRRGRAKNKDKLAAKPIRDDKIQRSRNRIRPTRDDSTDSARRSSDKDYGGKRRDQDKDTSGDKYVKQTVSKFKNTTSTRHTSARGGNDELSGDSDTTGDDKAGRHSKYYARSEDEPNRHHGGLSPPQRGRLEPRQSFVPSDGRERKRSSTGDRRHTSLEHRNRGDKRETRGRSERYNGEKRNSDTSGHQRRPSNGDSDRNDNSSSDEDGRHRDSERRSGQQHDKGRKRSNHPSHSDSSSSETRRTFSVQSSRWMKPDKYDGTTSFETYMCKFLNCADYNQWTEKDKRAYLRGSLDKEAAQLLWDSDQLTFDELVDKLRKRFGAKGMEERFQTELRCRRRKNGESIQELAQDIRRLLLLSYPREQSMVVEHLGRDAFLTALDDQDFELKIRERDPENLDAAVKLALRFEIARGAVHTSPGRGRHRVTRQVVQAETLADYDMQTRLAAVERQLQQTSHKPEHSVTRRGNSRQGREDSNHKGKTRSRAVEQDISPRTKQPTATAVLQDKDRQIDDMRAQLSKANSEINQMTRELSRYKHMEQLRMASQPQFFRRVEDRLPNRDNATRQGGGDRPRHAGPCWHCNENGHFARACPHRQQQQSGDQCGAIRSASTYVKGASQDCRAKVGCATYLRATVNGKECDCLLDSGSEVTLLPVSVVAPLELQPTKKTLTAANGTDIPVLGKVTVPFRTGNFKSSITGLVSDHVGEVMLGYDWLAKNKANWDFEHGAVKFGDQCYSLGVRHETKNRCRRVILQDDVEVPPRSQVDLPCKIVLRGGIKSTDGTCWSTKPVPVQSGVYVARTLAPGDRLVNVPVRVMNVQEQPHVIRAGTAISDLEPLSVIENNTAAEESNVVPDRDVTALKNSRPSTLTPEIPDYIEKLIDSVDDATPESAVASLRELLLSNLHVFSESENDLGRTDIVVHHIDTGSARPVRQQLRRFPPAHVEAISTHVDNMLQQGVIEPASSPWASNVVLVRKKDGTFRCCIDYRQLNNVTTKDAYPLPRIDSCLDAMAEAQWFSTIDLRSSYHQVGVAPEDRDKTSFICPRGMYRFRTMPFGLCNAGATFQRLMDIVMSGLNLEICLVYLDDIVVYAKTPEQHLQRLATVLSRLSDAGLKLKPEKCRFFRKSVQFLGHVISHEGIGTDPEKIKAVVEWPRPTSATEVRSFIGLAGYYRRFVRDFAKIASPLHALVRNDSKFKWSDQAQGSFDTLKLALTTPPILAMPNDQGEFVLDTDASDRAIGAVLSQRQDGVERVIAYASRSLDRREQNYCVTRKELLAIVHFLKYFKQYLLGRTFKVRTDHAALSWLRHTPDPIGQQARWLEQLEEFDFVVEHRPGVRHGNADSLSRRPCPKKDCACREPRQPTFGGPADQPSGTHKLIAGVSVDEATNSTVRNEVQPQVGSPSDVTSLDLCSAHNIQDAQKKDPDISYVYELVAAGSDKPTWDEVSPKSRDVKVLLSFWSRLAIHDGVLKRRFESVDGQAVHWQVILPKDLRNEFLRMIHGGVTGHLGYKKTTAAVQARAYWPTWSTDVAIFLKKCSACARYHRGALPRRAEMQVPRSGEPWERVSVDITGPHPKSSRQNQYILTIVDHFSKWAEAVPIRNHTAPTVAKALMVHVFYRYGMPDQLLTDRGTEFESELFSQLMNWLEIDKLRTTAYKPSTNGVVERFHKTLNSMLGKVVSETQRDWDDRLPSVMAAYRAAVHSSTGYTPNRLFLGRENRMPVDLAMGLPLHESVGPETVDDFVARQHEMTERAYRLVRDHLHVNAERRKTAYDLRVRKSHLCVGDWVWYYCPRRYLRRSPKWQRNYTGPFLIIRTVPPVNFVLQKTRNSKPFVAHADKLKKCLSETPQSWLADAVSGKMKLGSDERRQLQTANAEVGPETQPTSCSRGERCVPRGQALKMQYRRQREHSPQFSTDRPKRAIRRAPVYLHDYVC